jgi:hypothetical protein
VRDVAAPGPGGVVTVVNRPRIEVRRRRRVQLSRLFGNRCAYCRRRFHANRPFTIDHIVPLSLFATWSTVHLAPACLDCNRRKADRLPLSIALLLLWSTGHDPAGVDWPWLARLAHATESTHRPPDPIAEQSTPDLHDDPRHTRRHTHPGPDPYTHVQEAA